MNHKWIPVKAIRLLSLMAIISLATMPTVRVQATPPISGASISFGSSNGVGDVAENFVAIAAGDLDNDGWIDLATGFSSGTNELRVWENDETPFSDTWSGGSGNAVGDTSAQAYSVALGDLDHDGDLDLVSGDGNSDIYIWRNDGTPFDGAWTTNYNIGDGVSTVFGVAVADFDSDGNLDIVSVSLSDTGNEVIVWENPYTSGDHNPFDQTWSDHGVDSTTSLHSVAVADVNCDGKVDIIAGDIDNQVCVWSHDGSWTFTSRATLTGDGDIDALAVADVNRDGYVDVVSGGPVEGGGTYEVIVWENDADSPFDWSFTEHDTANTADDVNSLVAADFNNDGYPDFAAVTDTGEDNEVIAWENDADATFDWSFTQVDVGAETEYVRAVTAADFDNDGDTDLATGRESGTTYEVAIWQNTLVHRNAPWSASGNNFGPGNDATHALALGDVDGDGDRDLAVGNYPEQNVVYLNDGDGTFDTTSYNFGTGSDWTFAALALGDVDGDGDLDLAVGDGQGGQNVVYLNDGDGTFDTTSYNVGPGNDRTHALALGDVDGDGDLDLAIGNYNQQNVVYLNDGDGTFDTTSCNFGTGSDATKALALGDVDGDGDLDLAVGNTNYQQSVIYLNDGDGTFDTTSYNFGTGSDLTSALALGDVNGDGDLDLAIGNYNQQNVVYLNDGDGTFDTTSYNFGTGSDATKALALGDVDDDSDLDLTVGNYNQQSVIYLNDGDGTFDTTSYNFGTGSDATYTLALGDVDGDGDPDLAAGNYKEQNVVYFNQGGAAGLDVTSTAQLGLDDSETDDLLEVVVTHNGISGDNDLELANWELKFFGPTRDALTSAQANAVVENLYVYYDSNGDNDWSDEASAEVTIADLSLDSDGYQTVTFSDGDADVQVQQGTPRTYYVVVQMTSNASSQTPDTFRLLFDPDADAVVEDRSEDTSVSIEDTTATPSTDASASFIGEGTSDYSGEAVAGVGDVNGDGYEDFLIGAYQDNNRTGKTYLVLGQASGWAMDTNLSNADASFLGESTINESGRSVAGAGDVNGDGYDDFLIGAHYNDEGPGDNPGQAYLILGKASGWMDINLDSADASFWGEDDGDQAGWFVAGAGDVNGDGYHDFLIVAYEDEEGGDSAGQTYLILGKASGWSRDVNVATAATASFIGEDEDDHSGISVAGAGDVNGDGYDDFLIGAHGDDDGGDWAGQAYLILGRAAADWGMDYDLENADASFIGEDSNDYAGYSVAGAGDVNGDGYDDFLIGALGDEEGGNEAGQTYLILGKSSGWQMDRGLSTNADASFIGESADDETGRRVTGAGDVNGDGYDDFLIGVYQDDDAGDNAGHTYLILGKASGWAMDTGLSAANASFIGENAGDRSGCSVAGVGDADGDAYDDLLVGAYGNSEGSSAAGQSYLWLSPYPGPSQVSYARVLPAGNVTTEDFSTARTVIDFDSGTAGTVVATIHRSAPGGGDVASIWWEINTTKSGFNNDIDVTFHYLDSEITGLTEATLKVYTRASSSDSWSEWTSVSRDTNRNTITAQGLNGFSQFALGNGPPTAVELVGFTATSQSDAILLAWETACEINNVGFNLYRADAPDGDLLRLNETLIPSKALGSVIGVHYTFLDQSVEPGFAYYYWLEDMDLYGSATRHGPVQGFLPHARNLYLPLILKES